MAISKTSEARSNLDAGSGQRGAAVTLNSLDKRFESVVAVDGVSLDIEAGEFITLLGPSGSGKTTTLMMIAGFEIPTGGEIYIDGEPIVTVPPYRRNIGMVFQNYALFPHMTVEENIAFPLKQRRVDRSEIARRVEQALEVVKLPGYGARYPRQLSGGQQQRIAVARAIVFNPRVLLMDEPLGALDKKLREELQIEIKRLHEELGMTFIYVTHDQEEALVMSDRIAVMNKGQIEQLGSPEDLYDRPNSRFVASFIGESNFLDGDVIQVDGETATVGLGENHIRALHQGQAQAGHRATLAVRPEKLSFAQPANGVPAGGRNTLDAVVKDAIFVGEMRRYLVEADNGASFVVKQQLHHGVELHERGAAVTLDWHVEDTNVVAVGDEVGNG